MECMYYVLILEIEAILKGFKFLVWFV